MIPFLESKSHASHVIAIVEVGEDDGADSHGEDEPEYQRGLYRKAA